MKWCWIAVLMLLLATTGAQAAVYQYVPNVCQVPLINPPVKVLNILAGWPDPASREPAVSFLSQAHRNLVPSYDVLPIYIQVENTTEQAIYAYRLTMVMYDAFGDYLDTCKCNTIVNLQPKAKDYGRWALKTRNPLLTWTIVCYLDGVRFEKNNSVWRIDTEGVAALVPSTAPGVRFQAWHIIPDSREIIPQAPKEVPKDATP